MHYFKKTLLAAAMAAFSLTVAFRHLRTSLWERM